MKKRMRATLSFLGNDDVDGVERDDPNGPPTAFRIWKAGDNTTDHGPSVLTARSIELLLEEQERRGNRYSIDINHLSLDKNAPLENQRAVGFFSLAARGDDLWAVACEWTDVVRAGLCKRPPEWRYHSPAYDVHPETGEIIGLTNLALTNTPATWGVTALASRGANQKGSSRMKFEDVKAAFEGADDDAKKAAWTAIAKAMASKAGEDKPEEQAAEGDDDAPESKKEAKRASEDEPEKKEAEDEPEKKDTKASRNAASVIASQDSELAKRDARIAALEARFEAEERKTLLASREMTKTLASKLSKMPLEAVREICAELPPKQRKDLAAAAKVEATRGEGQGDGTTSRLPKEEGDALRAQMGLATHEPKVIHAGRTSTFPVMTRDQARAVRATKGGK